MALLLKLNEERTRIAHLLACAVMADLAALISF